MPMWDFNKVALQLYWNRKLAWVFSCKFAAYFQNTFFQEHLLVAAYVLWFSGTRARKTLGHLATQALEAVGHSKGTWTLKGHLGTQAIEHLSSRGTWGTLFSRLLTCRDTLICCIRSVLLNTLLRVPIKTNSLSTLLQKLLIAYNKL